MAGEKLHSRRSWEKFGQQHGMGVLVGARVVLRYLGCLQYCTVFYTHPSIRSHRSC